VERTLVMLLDNTEYVPAIKSCTQKQRDGGGEGAVVMDERDYENYMARRTDRATAHDHLIIDEFSADLPLRRATVWRSVNLRLQLVRLITHALLLGDPLPPAPRVLVLDDGFAINPDTFCEKRSAMLDDYDFYDRSAFAQECLVSALSRHHMTQRLYLYPDGKIARQRAWPAGEADIKVLHHISREHGARRYMVVTQDTDAIFILLLHMKTLLDPATGEPDADLELWLDTRRPQEEPKKDKPAASNRPYRFINIKTLYCGILQLFAREYPSVANPIETLVLLAYSLETDFTRAFHPYLGVQPHTVWDTFSELHHPPPPPTKKPGTEEGFLLFRGVCKDDETTTQPAERKRQYVLPRTLHGVLNRVVRVHHNPANDAHELAVDELALQRFYYLLCEFKVRADLALVGYSAFGRLPPLGTKYILDPDQLFMRVAELEDKVALCRRGGLQAIREREAEEQRHFMSLLEEEKRAAAQASAGARPVIRSKFSPPPAPKPQPQTTGVPVPPVVRWTEFDLLTTEEQEVAHPITDERVVELARREIPPAYGIPRHRAMLARIYRVEWLMNYHQNGWLSADEYALNFGQLHERSHTLSKHGWRVREIEQSDEAVARGDFNSTYVTMRYTGEGAWPEAGVMPFRVFVTEETDEVYNRRHEAYAQQATTVCI
jgi:hypothetical protein